VLEGLSCPVYSAKFEEEEVVSPLSKSLIKILLEMFLNIYSRVDLSSFNENKDIFAHMLPMT